MIMITIKAICEDDVKRREFQLKIGSNTTSANVSTFQNCSPVDLFNQLQFPLPA